MKIAIFILCHHKPWLIRSSLLSLFSQYDDHDYDLHFIMIKGDGENKLLKKYKKYFEIKKKTGVKNTQLSKFNSQVFNELKKLKKKYYVHEFQNDHGLDSGAWIKLIKSKIWIKYDYNILLMEGFLFSSNNVLKSLRKFLKQKKPDFISSAHEKRFFKINNEQNKFETNESYHDYSIKKIWSKLLEIKKIKKIYKKSNNYIIRDQKKIHNITEHHISNYSFTFFEKIKLIIKSIIFSMHIYNKKKSVLITSSRKVFINSDKISNNHTEINGIRYHVETSPFFFGCSCQHVFSKKMMTQTKHFFKKNNIYKIAELPYFGEVFEIIWGSLPKVLNKKKWYFNGIHRVRKNLINYQREDNINGLVKYLNLYNLGNIKFSLKNNDIKYKISNQNNLKILKLIK